MEKRLLAIGAHADDIELDMGGTLLKYKDYGYEITYVMSTNNMSGRYHRVEPDGTLSHTTPLAEEEMQIRMKEAEAGAALLGTKPISLDYPQRHYFDGQSRVCVDYGSPRPSFLKSALPCILMAHESEDAIERVKHLILEQDAEAVLTHGHLGDNLEHVATCLLVTHAYRRAAKEGYEGMLLYAHCLAAMTFRDNYTRWDTHIDVSDFWERKLALIAVHVSQKPDVHRLDFPTWGAACGCRHAEVFSLASEGTPAFYYTEFEIEIFKNRR